MYMNYNSSKGHDIFMTGKQVFCNRITAFCDVIACSLVDKYQHFQETSEHIYHHCENLTPPKQGCTNSRHQGHMGA